MWVQTHSDQDHPTSVGIVPLHNQNILIALTVVDIRYLLYSLPQGYVKQPRSFSTDNLLHTIIVSNSPNDKTPVDIFQ